ncbi:MAG TPA: YceI family protein [Patescibacteria group bacterium]|nr:YceI family protein [Patescibacteria group bacterium]
MNKRTLIAANAALLLLACLSAQAADQMTKYYARSGSKMRIEGTSTIHDWQVEGTLIGGYFEVGPNFPSEPGQAATPGKVEAHAEPFIMVRSLKSIEKDGKPYSDRMDEVMYEHLKEPQNKKIAFHLTDLTLKEPAKSKDAPYQFEAKGQLSVAGVTKDVTMPVSVLPLGDKKLKVSGKTTLKMTDFKVDPPNPLGLGIKTGDPVNISFDWIVGQRTTPPPAAK